VCKPLVGEFGGKTGEGGRIKGNGGKRAADAAADGSAAGGSAAGADRAPKIVKKPAARPRCLNMFAVDLVGKPGGLLIYRRAPHGISIPFSQLEDSATDGNGVTGLTVLHYLDENFEAAEAGGY